MFEVIPASELPKVLDAAQTGRCVACYADAYGNGFYCPACDPPIQEIADLMEYGAPLQLTTGCTCRDKPRWYPGRPGDPLCPLHGDQGRRPVTCQCWIVRTAMGQPMEVEQNPDCPLHWAKSWLPPCTCRYGLHPTIWCPTHLIDVPGVGQRGAAWTFRIHPKCQHHGDARRSGRYLLEGGGLYEYVLDEAERRGH